MNIIAIPLLVVFTLARSLTTGCASNQFFILMFDATKFSVTLSGVAAGEKESSMIKIRRASIHWTSRHTKEIFSTFSRATFSNRPRLPEIGGFVAS